MNEVEGRQTGGWGGADFPSTHWSVVLAARDPDSVPARSALESLCQAYWYALYAYVRRSGHSPEDAQDLTQAFFAHLLGHDALRNVAPAKGRFRSFLLTSLKRFIVGRWRKDHALKRGGEQRALSLDQHDAESRYLLEPADLADPEVLYERRWALALLNRVLERVETEAAAAGKQELFSQVQPFLSGDRGERTYDEIAPDLGMTEGALKMAVLRLRERLRVLFREEIAQTVSSEAEAREEVRHLLAVLGASTYAEGREVNAPGTADLPG